MEGIEKFVMDVRNWRVAAKELISVLFLFLNVIVKNSGIEHIVLRVLYEHVDGFEILDDIGAIQWGALSHFYFVACGKVQETEKHFFHFFLIKSALKLYF